MGSLCVATFLLSVGSPYIADRMVLTEFPNTYAHVYREISKVHQFPLSKPSSDVFMIKSDTQRPGTSYAIYCSQKWNGKNIMDGLLGQIIPFTIDGPSRDNGRINPENPCSTQLASMAKKKNYRLIWTSEIIKSNACTGKDLLELAIKGYITIHKHHFISPREYLKPKIRIYFDVGIEIQFGEEQVYFKGEKVNDETEDEILMWYTGYLHIFRRRIKKGGWYASTSLTSIDLNGYKISKFIRRNSPPFNRFIETWEFLETLVDKRDHYPGLTEKELTKERQRKTSHGKIERLKLDNLRPSDVHGFISSFKWYGDSSSGH